MQEPEYKCTSCESRKPASAFGREPRVKRGRKARCFECEAASSREYRHRDIEAYRERMRARTQKRSPQALANNRERDRRRRAEEPQKAAARWRVKEAIETGRLERPEACSHCEKPHPKVQGHHPDYDKPLEVIWLCPTCHKHVHMGEIELQI